MMKHPDANAGLFVSGSQNIDSKLAQGWEFVPSERNHLLPHRIPSENGSASTETVMNEEIAVQVKRGPGRPRKQQR